MADTDLAMTGKDYSLQLLVGGVPVFIQDKIINFSAKPVYDEIQIKGIGTDGSEIGKEFSHYEGTIELAHTTSALDDLIDTYNAALKAGLAVVINVGERHRYRNGVSRGYTWPDIKPDFDQSVARGEAAKFTINWKSGKHRIKTA